MNSSPVSPASQTFILDELLRRTRAIYHFDPSICIFTPSKIYAPYIENIYSEHLSSSLMHLATVDCCTYIYTRVCVYSERERQTHHRITDEFFQDQPSSISSPLTATRIRPFMSLCPSLSCSYFYFIKNSNNFILVQNHTFIDSCL